MTCDYCNGEATEHIWDGDYCHSCYTSYAINGKTLYERQMDRMSKLTDAEGKMIDEVFLNSGVTEEDIMDLIMGDDSSAISIKMKGTYNYEVVVPGSLLDSETDLNISAEGEYNQEFNIPVDFITNLIEKLTSFQEVFFCLEFFAPGLGTPKENGMETVEGPHFVAHKW